MIDRLGLAYLNQRNLLKSYILIKNLIKELKKITKKQNEIRCITLYVYLK